MQPTTVLNTDTTNQPKPLLDVRDLSVTFQTKEGTLKAVDRVSFNLARGDILGIVGESGCGKSLTLLSILRLIQNGAQVSGSVTYYRPDKEGNSTSVKLDELNESQLTKIRGTEIAMIFQDPLSSLNPVYRVGDQIIEAIRLHNRISKREASKIAVDLMKRVGIQSAEERARSFPHQLSGGMRQRIMIAMALSCNAKLLLADEPTTMIDEISQMQIIQLLKELRHSFGSIIYVTHDLGVVAELCTRVAVMYAGRLVELADVQSIFKRPMHPYTKLLLESVPRVDRERQKLTSIPGAVKPPVNPKNECRFVDRCPYVIEQCRKELPKLVQTDTQGTHQSACIRWKEI